MTMQRQIKFTHTCSSTVLGSFVAGDVLRCHADTARHFVVDAQCAVYDDAEPEVKEPPPVTPQPQTKRGRRASA
jgi:hypothetical protein